MPTRKNPPPDDAFRERLEAAKRQSTLQLLFKAARLLDEEALARVAAKPGRPRLRRSHTALFPHIDLDGTRITDLAERVGVTKQAVSQLVDDLVAAGVVDRVEDPGDARARRVVFTERGRAGIFEGLEVLRELETELAKKIGKGKMKALGTTLAEILALRSP
jgi:DNA-binding MarR family transcriptional regulator